MKSFKYIPESIKSEKSSWEGHVLLKEVDFDSKCKVLEEIEDLKTLGQVRYLVKASKDFYLEVCLKKKDGSEEVKSFEEMTQTSSLHRALSDCAHQLFLRMDDSGND